MHFRYHVISIVFAALIAPSTVRAGGLYLYEIDAGQVSLASAGWAARADDASTAFTNPAGMTRLSHSQFTGAVQGANAEVDFAPDNDTTTSGRRGDASAWLPLADGFYVHSLSPRVKLGMSVVGMFGLAIDYNDDWVGRYYAQEAQAQAVFLTPSVAYKLTDWLSVGAGLNTAYGIFRDKAAINNAINRLGDGSFTLHDTAWGFGAIAGVLIEPGPRTRFGVSYVSQISLNFSDTPTYSNLGPLLAAGNALSRNIDLGMTLPNSVMVSGYHELTPRWSVMGNLGWQQWSQFGEVSVVIGSPEARATTIQPGYDDTWHGAIGTQYRILKPWVVSCGFAYDSSMLTSRNRTPTVPVGQQWRFGMGAHYDWSRDLTLSLAYELVWSGNLDMDVDRGPLAGRVSGTYGGTNLQFVTFGVQYRLG
jgi:long-chain fatty acid transport protein